MIQYWLINNIFKKMNVHKCAMAYRKGISIKTNANRHSKYTYFLKIDFENFFPSITFKDFLPYIESWYESMKPDWMLNKNALQLINNSCFYKDDRLPIGYPSSPIISNIVMYNFDVLVNTMLIDNKEKFSYIMYTRYADDMIFSTNKKGVCKEIYEMVKDIIKKMKSPVLKINTRKTRFVSSSGGSAIVTGLRVCHDSHITLHRKYKDKVRLLISLYAKDSLSKGDLPKLKGHLSYIKNVDPVFYTKLQQKFFASIENLRSI